jgi:hypothetical protein
MLHEEVSVHAFVDVWQEPASLLKLLLPGMPPPELATLIVSSGGAVQLAALPCAGV